jgi:spermine oxidase
LKLTIFPQKKRPDPTKYLDIDSKIQLNKEVINIQWNPNGKNEKVIITCSDDSKFEADHVIVTVSLGVLKDRHVKLFNPNLPEDKIKAISNYGFGTLDKIFLEFSEPFWPKNDKKFSGYSFLWSKKDIDEVQKSEKSWLIDIPGFDRVDAFPNLIEFFYAGQSVKEFESLSDEKITNDVIWLLEKFLATSIKKPIKMIRTKWQTNKNFLGSYSFNSMNAQKAKVTPEMLAKHLTDASGKPKILFAGEATSSKFQSYAHGAVSSGWVVGKHLVNQIK